MEEKINSNDIEIEDTKQVDSISSSKKSNKVKKKTSEIKKINNENAVIDDSGLPLDLSTKENNQLLDSEHNSEEKKVTVKRIKHTKRKPKETEQVESILVEDDKVVFENNLLGVQEHVNEVKKERKKRSTRNKKKKVEENVEITSFEENKEIESTYAQEENEVIESTHKQDDVEISLPNFVSGDVHGFDNKYDTNSFVSNQKNNKTFKRFVKYFSISLVILGIGFCIGLFYNKQIHPINDTSSFSDVVGEIESILENNWIYRDNYDDLHKILEDKALYGMTYFEEDPYTSFMSKEELEDFSTGINMDYVGIGVQYSIINNKAIVSRVFVNSPAEKAGMLVGDVIERVDGVSVKDLSSEEIKALVVGEENTDVVITVARNSNNADLIIKRSAIDSSVYCYVEEDYVVMELSSFGVSTSESAMNYLDLYPDYHKIIIDLRNNTGGYQTAVKELSGMFIGRDKIYLRQVDVNGKVSNELTSASKVYDNFDQIVIIVNNNTASAAEVFAICLKEQLPNVTIVGERTYGKGVIQTTQYLLSGDVIKYSSYYWYSPNGVSINKVGIQPDIEIGLNEISYKHYFDMLEGEEFKEGDFSPIVSFCQEGLNFMKYDVTRKDGYFDDSFVDVVKKFQSDRGIGVTGTINNKTYNVIISNVMSLLSNPKNDLQLQKAIEIIEE